MVGQQEVAERMVGLRGAVGHELPTTRSNVPEHGVASERRDGDVSLQLSTHPILSGEQPIETDDGVEIWVLGEVYGFDDTPVGGTTGHTPRPKHRDSVRYCADLYAEHGREFVHGLNGNCVGVLYDREAGDLSIFTDRLGTVPIYYATPGDGIVFATEIDSIASHPDVETEFDLGYLHEYLVYRRPFGVKTPLVGIEELQPASITTVNVDDGSIDVERYWRPRYRPRNAPFETFVDEFTERFTRLVDEWRRDDLEYGVLLSGGSDSRLNLAALGPGITAFHMAGWMSREARTAERVAIESGNEFVFLRRDHDYQEKALVRNQPFSNFNGWFTQGYATGFEEEITARVDVLLSGMYADTLFKGHAIPSPTYDLGPVGNLTLPLETELESLPEFIDWLCAGAPSDDNLPFPNDLRSTLEENIYWDDGEIVHHGVRYESIEDLVYCSGYFPLSNDDDIIFQNSLHEMLPYRTPFLDNRLVDLSLRMPIRYRLRRNVIDAAVKRLNPKLASIPHADAGIGLGHSFPVDFAGRKLKALWRKHVAKENPPRPYLSNGSWVNDAELIREDDFYWRAIEGHADVIEGLDFLEFEDVRACYQAHLDGQDNVVELYTLLTVLTMPLTHRLAGVQTDDRPNRSDHRPPITQEGSR
ncbi:asparagine synthase-related protein [Halalkalicoccus sp. NIPERK01]|uniref:asparagine synthase-related protein n=1 Tax=Halalkalicoccus sp. NIPERK01 TaxID=3053469 RepID=UPI00256F1925|nr:asparagine synthase-related protein [Halalkalicoccus sp. NIPERK01]MDL5362033.1 asparagine synthase-related protein [Halalkalicoccus sp. NIPERK01]